MYATTTQPIQATETKRIPQQPHTEGQTRGFANTRPRPVLQRVANNTGLPNNVKQGVESLSGMDISDVRVFRNSTKPATLNAHAYTQGSHIYLGPGQEKHLAHEAWHVVQQNQGRVQATQQIAGLHINDQPHLEREADMMAHKAVKLENQYAPPLYTTPLLQTPTTLQRQVIQRLAMGERPFEKGYNILTHSNRWFHLAENYEQRLGSYAYNHSISKKALDVAINKMEDMFQKFYQDKATMEQVIQEIFFRNNPQSAGQVGLDLDLDEMFQVLHQGNLRERMTAFYNASYFDAGYGENLKKGFKAILHDIIHAENWELSETLGLNTVEIKNQAGFMKGLSRETIHLLLSHIAAEKSYNYGKDIFALGNLALQSQNPISDTVEIATSQKGRENRDAADKLAHKKTAMDYQRMNAPLSERELDYVSRHLPAHDIKNQKLPWEEGIAVHKIRPTEQWYKSVHDEMKMPVTDGVSGTTTRMLSSFIWLKTGEVPIRFRLAIMGWMLTSNDHSLYEIMRGSHMAGVKTPGEEELLNDVHRMYMNIAPLKTTELRDHVAQDKLFPHEILYRDQTTQSDTNNEPLKALTPETAELGIARLTAAQIAGDKRYEKLSDAHAIAITGYTGGLHSSINALMNNESIPQDEELKTHANMTVEGLSLIPAEKSGTVFRGDWEPTLWQKYKENAVITLDTFTSFTRDRVKAEGFMQQGRFSHQVLLSLNLKGIGAKDIAALSKNPDQEEVLLMPGSKIRIDKVQWLDDNTKAVTATEVP